MSVPQLSMDFDRGALLRDRGHADAMTHNAVEIIRDVIRELARSGERFTANTVRERVTDSVRAQLAIFPNVLGAVFRAAALAGEIRDTGDMVQASESLGRKRRLVLWAGAASLPDDRRPT